MANPTDTDQPELAQTQVERQTIQEVIRERTEQEREDRILAQRVARRQERDERATNRKKAHLDRITAQKKRRVGALADAQTKVQSHVGDASRALRRALAALQAVPIHRNSPEGREQTRIARSLTAAMGSLRAVGRSAYVTTDGVDLDFDDFDAGTID
jgi:hypothetical protein